MIALCLVVLPLGYMLWTTDPARGEPSRAGIVGRIVALIIVGALIIVVPVVLLPGLAIDPMVRLECLLWLLAYLTPSSVLIVWQALLILRAHERMVED